MSPATAPRTVECISQPARSIVAFVTNTIVRLGWQQPSQSTSKHEQLADDARIFLAQPTGQESEKTKELENAHPTKLILAFDIGTIYSGISYCIHEPGRHPEIYGVAKFPALGLVGGDTMVPSLLYYDRSGNVRAAGFEALTETVAEVSLKEGWMKAEGWKLHLHPKHTASSITPDKNLPPLPSGKSAVDVLTDFIGYLFKCAKTHIQKHHPALEWPAVEDSIEYVFTHPNGWEGGQQQPYRQAVARAGLTPCTPKGRSRVHMLTEGEASLHYCVARSLNAKKVDQATPHGVVVIDAGGGTVDLNMFSMTLNAVSCKEVAPAECRLQGSVFVTHRAKALFQNKLEGWEHCNDKAISEIADEFDQSAKLVIKNDQDPICVRVASRRYNNSDYNILCGRLKLLGKEATGLLDDSVNAIIEAFEKQAKLAKMPITTVFLVGGFLENDWLWSRLQSYFRAKNMHIRRPNCRMNKTVANGAVLCYVHRANQVVISQGAHATNGVLSDVAGHFVSQLRKGVAFARRWILQESLLLV